MVILMISWGSDGTMRLESISEKEGKNVLWWFYDDSLQSSLDVATEAWGIKVERVEM